MEIYQKGGTLSRWGRLKDVVGLGSWIAEFNYFNTEGLFSIVRLLFHDLRVDNDLQPPQWPPKGQIEAHVFLEN